MVRMKVRRNKNNIHGRSFEKNVIGGSWFGNFNTMFSGISERVIDKLKKAFVVGSVISLALVSGISCGGFSEYNHRFKDQDIVSVAKA